MECSSKADGNVIHNNLTLSLNKRVYPAEAWPDLHAVIRLFQRAESDFIRVDF